MRLYYQRRFATRIYELRTHAAEHYDSLLLTSLCIGMTSTQRGQAAQQACMLLLALARSFQLNIRPGTCELLELVAVHPSLCFSTFNIS